MLNKTVTIDGVKIGEGQYPYIIAEMSANHGNDINKAIEIIRSAKQHGAHAVKIQTYTADTLTLDCRKKEFEAKGAWQGQYLYDLYVDASMPWEWTSKLMEIAKEEGITLFSSPFDNSAVDFLESFDMAAYKIASPEIIDLPLIQYIAKTKKPIILSTGNATLAQINEAVEVIYMEGVRDLVILKCTSEYPAPANKINLKTIQNLKDIYKCPVGLSDHTLGSAIPIASVAMGANVIEKHYLVDKNIETADSFFSAGPEELKAIADGSKLVYDAVGDVAYPVISPAAQRSLMATEDINAGERLQIGKNFKSLRPGGGIEPKYMPIVDRSIAKIDIPYGTLLSWDMID